MSINISCFTPFALSAMAFSAGPAFSAKQIMKLMPDDWDALFDDSPIILPIPDGAPRELPLVVLRSASSGYSCTITSDRIVFQWANDKGGIPAPTDFYQRAANFHATAKRTFNVRFGRVAAVCNRIAPDQNPAKYLAEHFCKEQWLAAPFNRPENFEINSHKKYNYKNFIVNSWIKNKSAVINMPNFVGVHVEQDLNTLQEQIEDTDLTEVQLQSFFNGIQAEFDEILSCYYP